ncbi:MAG: hypothetical protein R3D66_06260 [Alphaproteobacteria bacterium]
MIDHRTSAAPPFKRATVSFTQKDLERVAYLKNALEVNSNAQTLSIAIKLAHHIVDAMKKGEDIIFEDPDGSQREMIIPGLTKDI